MSSSTSQLPLSASWRSEPLSATEQAKVRNILKACRDRHLVALRDLATSEGGLIEDEIRRTACTQAIDQAADGSVLAKWCAGPVLLGSDSTQGAPAPDVETREKHRDEDQVQLDVNRSFVYYPEDESDKRKDLRKHELSDVITKVLRAHPMLHYFQGYHDIVQVLLLVLGADAAVPAVARLSLLHIRDFMLPTMTGTETHLQLLPAILYAVDPVLCKHLSATQPFFALAATLTLYAHDIEEYGNIARLFDFLLASPASIPLYLFAVIVKSRKAELLEIEEDEPEMLHSILSKLPKPLKLESLIRRTSELYQRHPPESLPNRAWSRVSANSVLKTTHDPLQLAKQTLADGEVMFERQAAEIRRADEWKRRKLRLRLLSRKYRRPARAATFGGAAIAVVVIAYWLRGGAGEMGLGSALHVLSRLRQEAWGVLRGCIF
ncbi:GTPase-activating protein gyp8 [Friedmanniomyces endolithicus]|uniref:GTPase-activating protein gyp8 n=1 Tax=Friedmanniomyces endolithicus TaxID=329885 RepID=A0AAN6JEX0_9PEZI|nr:GTPase-activating protein gyp8 [Friedmanniomyces endolithicus]KAK0292495.1 GTPase-activating protein gyp8 [Friedmanniomyces endolithicus]KAK0303217.1 GTPase-activating protein gyp8 [Friedmanniomyces endolithicus]KAK0321851.1 GTPase-activating protein gyp8 [Friedmanniomyces endolithicus]KAK0829284.1 GTPase-activating protein gyp8 [Friedmanniomyces endolithicus]